MTVKTTMSIASPWIAQLRKSRPIRRLEQDHRTDVCVIGAGIAGITTAYYLLKDTTKSVTVIDAQRLAHGATGHNAGQIASYFEHSFGDIVKEYGLDLAADAQRSVLDSWDLLDHIIHEAEIPTKPESFAGFAGCTTVAQLLSHLENAYLRAQKDVRMSFAYVVNDPSVLKRIPKKYVDLYAVVPKENVLKKLETDKPEYIAALSVRKGCMNSAKFCEELVEYMQRTYPDRFFLFEESPVREIDIKGPQLAIVRATADIKTKKLVLCTNGYATLRFVQEDLDRRFRLMRYGLVGFMAGYEVNTTRDSTAITYFPKAYVDKDSAYYYLTRRRVNKKKALVCIGGPEKRLDEAYDAQRRYIKEGSKECAAFLRSTHKYTPRPLQFKYAWEGLMGFTASHLRCVGSDPTYPCVNYNLGCNGVGILTSIFSGKRLSLLDRKIPLKASVFDADRFFARLEASTGRKHQKRQAKQKKELVEMITPLQGRSSR